MNINFSYSSCILVIDMSVLTVGKYRYSEMIHQNSHHPTRFFKGINPSSETSDILGCDNMGIYKAVLIPGR